LNDESKIPIPVQSKGLFALSNERVNPEKYIIYDNTLNEEMEKNNYAKRWIFKYERKV
jgi:hypothetical protein